MPELPDLQVFSSNLKKALAGKTVTAIEAPVPKNLNVSIAELKKTLSGEAIKEVYREGKELYITFGKGDRLSLHLMLHGSLHLSHASEKQKNTVLRLVFDDETALALADWQGRAKPTLNPKPPKAPDALSGEVDAAFLEKALQRKALVKNVLLDQKVIRGIGNAYADEILWEARISPFSVSNKIPAAGIRRLAKAIKSVLKQAEKQIRKSHPDIISGEVRDFLDIHNARKKQSPTGTAIEYKTVGGRKTYFTSEQELFE